MINNSFPVLIWSRHLENRNFFDDYSFFYKFSESSLDFKNQNNFENIIDFVNNINNFNNYNIIIEDVLGSYKTESYYRYILSTLFSTGNLSSWVVISEKVENSNLNIIFRALRALGINLMVNSTLINDRYFIFFKRGMAFFNIQAWLKNDLPILLTYNDTEFATLLSEKIKDHSPFSLIRIGHCEVRFLAAQELYGPSDVEKSALIQWGEAISIEKQLWVANNLALAVLDSDALGFKNRSTFSSNPLNIFDNSVRCALSSKRLLGKNHIQVSPNIHYSLALNPVFLRSLMYAIKIVLVTSHGSLQKIFSEAFHGKIPIITISLPGQFRPGSRPESIEVRFARFKEIEVEVSRLAGPGIIFLIGAGVAGKHFCSVAKKNGSVALDLGSALDAWAGLDSRGRGFSPALKNSLSNLSLS